MRLTAKQILLPIAGLLAIGLFAQSKAAKFLNFFIKGAALAWDAATPVLKLDVAVQNPSNQQFVVRSISGTAYLRDATAGTFSMFQTVVINPNSEAVIPLYVRLNPSGIVSDLIRMMQVGGSGITVRLQGHVNANGFVNELSLNYKIT